MQSSLSSSTSAAAFADEGTAAPPAGPSFSSSMQSSLSSSTAGGAGGFVIGTASFAEGLAAFGCFSGGAYALYLGGMNVPFANSEGAGFSSITQSSSSSSSTSLERPPLLSAKPSFPTGASAGATGAVFTSGRSMSVGFVSSSSARGGGGAAGGGLAPGSAVKTIILRFVTICAHRCWRKSASCDRVGWGWGWAGVGWVGWGWVGSDKVGRRNVGGEVG